MAHEPEYMEHEHEEPDPWHAHTPDEGMPQEEHAARAKVSVVFAAFVIMTIGLVVTVMATVVYFNRHMTKLRQERLETTVVAEQQLGYWEESRAELDRYGWEDPDRGVVRISIDRAMHKVVERYSVGDGR